MKKQTVQIGEAINENKAAGKIYKKDIDIDVYRELEKMGHDINYYRGKNEKI